MEPGSSSLHEELRGLLGDFCGGFGVSLTLVSESGARLLSVPEGGDPPFCRTVQALTGSDECRRQEERMLRLAADRGGPLIFTCHAGCRCCLYPLVREGRVIATATIRGFRYAEEASPPLLRTSTGQAGLAALRHQFRALPKVSADLEQRMVRLFAVVSEHIVSHGLMGAAPRSLFEMIVEYIRSHLSRPTLQINEVAEYVRRSPSTVSHVVKKEAGISFKRLVIEQRLRAAEEMLSDDFPRSIGEVADALGFSDQFYFSRLYKKYRGYPPRAYLKRAGR